MSRTKLGTYVEMLDYKFKAKYNRARARALEKRLERSNLMDFDADELDLLDDEMNIDQINDGRHMGKPYLAY